MGVDIECVWCYNFRAYLTCKFQLSPGVAQRELVDDAVPPGSCHLAWSGRCRWPRPGRTHLGLAFGHRWTARWVSNGYNGMMRSTHAIVLAGDISPGSCVAAIRTSQNTAADGGRGFRETVY
jgi:hypothetical protein